MELGQVLLEQAGDETDSRPLEHWITTFHLAFFVLDPFTAQSALLLPTAGRIMRAFRGANCRVAWLLTATAEEAQEFLGPWSEEMLTFVDPSREVVKSLELEELPAFVHLNHGLEIENQAQGWDPPKWSDAVSALAKQLNWSRPQIPEVSDPPPFAGTAALG